MSSQKSYFKKLESGLYQADLPHAVYRIDRSKGQWKLLKLVNGEWALLNTLKTKMACELHALKDYLNKPLSDVA